MKYIISKCLLLFLICSCTDSNKRYDFQIINETSFELTSIDFRYGDFSDKIVLEPSASSAVFDLNCTSRELLGPCTAFIQIEEFRDSDTLLLNNCGVEIGRPAFEDQEIVIFRIWDDGELSDSCPNNIFRITY